MPANQLNWMLWFEEDPKITPQASLEAAAAHFEKKYGNPANRLQVPLDWSEEVAPGGLHIERKSHVRPRHLHLAFDPALLSEDQASTANLSPQGD
jgi:hypothetical protein